MRIVILLLCLLMGLPAFSQPGTTHIPNAIDSLYNRKQVLSFIRQHFDAYYSLATTEGELNDTQKMRCFNRNGYHKVDINGDGRTDLLEAGNNLMAFVDSGNGHYQRIFISGCHYDNDAYYLTGIDTTTDLPLINLRRTWWEYSKEGSKKAGEDLQLIYKHGTLVEYYPQPLTHRIERVQLETMPCFGTCPVFSMDIDNSGNAYYTAESHNNEKGKFNGQISAQEKAYLDDMLNDIHFSELKDAYSASGTCQPGADYIIIYDGGKTKKISDDGQQGTFGLARLYELLQSFREGRSWTKVGDVKDGQTIKEYEAMQQKIRDEIVQKSRLMKR